MEGWWLTTGKQSREQREKVRSGFGSQLNPYMILGFLAVLIAILISGTIQTLAANPNKEGDSHPTRLKLNECIADVKEVTAWDEKETLAAARKICEIRQSHTKQKARFLTSLKKLRSRVKIT